METNEPAQCHTSDINDELGLITHLLTDKTGLGLTLITLTLFLTLSQPDVINHLYYNQGRK